MNNYKQLLVKNITNLESTFIKLDADVKTKIALSFAKNEPRATAECLYHSIIDNSVHHGFLVEALKPLIDSVVDEYKDLIEIEMQPKVSILNKIKLFFYNLDFWRNSAKEYVRVNELTRRGNK